MEAMSLKIKRARFTFEELWSRGRQSRDTELDLQAMRDRDVLLTGTAQECAEVQARLGRAAES